MQFKEIFREKYRVALLAARANDLDGVIAALRELYRIFAEQYSKKNGDSIYVKAQLSRWKDISATYLHLAETHGLKDKRLRDFFGLPDEEIGYEGIVGNEGGEEKKRASGGGIDIAGIVPETPTAPSEGGIADMPPADVPEVPVNPSEEIPEVPEEPIPEKAAPAQKGAAQPAEGEGGGTLLETPAETVADGAGEPQSLAEFVGQRHIVKVLMKEIAIAKAEGRHHLDNILLLGNPGLGKTTLMKLIAKELGVKYVAIDGTKFRNSQTSVQSFQNLLQNVARENVPVVIAIDEIHMLNDDLQSGLLTLLEERVYISPPDKNGVIKHIPIDEFTFIGATTDDDKVLATIKDRCLRLKFQLVDYSPEELREIYKRKVSARGLTITEEAIETCIPRSRGSLRYVNSFVDGLNLELYDDNGKRVSTHIDLAIALRFFEERGIDPIGLNKKDLEILRVIEEDPSGAIGAETLSARIGLDVKKYLSECEPFLIKIGFVTVSGRGRGLTEKAINYLKAHSAD